MTKIDVKTFALLLGCIWSMSVLTLGIVSMITDKGSKIVRLFSSVYVGYQSGVKGSLIGAVWGFLDGIISGMIIAWIYNKIVF